MIVSFEQRQQSKTTACVCFEEVTKLKKALLTVSVMSIIIKQTKRKWKVRKKKTRNSQRGHFLHFITMDNVILFYLYLYLLSPFLQF